MTTSRLTRWAVIGALAGLAAANASAQTVDFDLCDPQLRCDIPVGKAVTIVYSAQVNAPPFPSGKNDISNQGTVSGSNFSSVLTDDPDTGAANDPTLTPLDAAPDLSITKSDGGASVAPGGTVLYNMTISNTGTQNTTGVVVTDVVPPNTTFNAGASLPGWVCVPDNNPGSTCTFNVGNFAGGQVNALNIAFTVANPVAAGVAQISNTASIGDGGVNGPDPTPGNNAATDTTPVNAEPDMALTKTDGGATSSAGGTITYALNYSNVGNQGATGVTLTETVPANTTFNPGASTPGWVCTPDNNAGSTCTLLIAGEVAGAGGNGSANFAVTVANPLPAGVSLISNTASVSNDGANGADPNGANNSSTDTTPVSAAPDLTLTKSDGGDTATVPGDAAVAYTLSYTNVGTQGATGVVITDVVPANTTFNAGLSTFGWVCTPDNNAGSTCTFPVGAVPATGGGSSGSVTYAVTVNSTLPPAVTQISNTASIADDGANGADLNGGNNGGSDTTPVTAVPDLRVSKTDNRTLALPRQVLSYQISLDNIGAQGATGAVLTETVPANTVFEPGLSTAGWVCVPDNNAGSSCTFNVAGTVAAGAPAQVIVFAVRVTTPVVPGTTIVNTVSVTDDGSNGPDANTSNNTASDNNTLVTTKGDFNGDGHADLLFQHLLSARVVSWFMDGPNKLGATFTNPCEFNSPPGCIGTAGSGDWRVRGADDFDADGKADIVFRNVTNGEIRIWMMDGTLRTAVGTPNPSGVSALNWDIVGTGHFNASVDAKPDLLWQNSTSTKLVVWTMNGLTRLTGVFTTPDQAATASWKAVGTGDFNADGQSDILWRNTISGAVAVWFMNGTVATSWALMTGEPNLNWKIVAVSDADNDQDPDITWWNASNGKIRLWTMNGIVLQSSAPTNPDQVAVPLPFTYDANWQIAGPK